ncbi:MAG: beta-ketoacyl-ACP synthase [Hyphomonadaceae bacterium]|nr:beta-ketoacyl-ACP synthase [Hyphomonadaceae bacterium]
MRRVVITGMSYLTALGEDWNAVGPRLHTGEAGIRFMPEWEGMSDLNARLGGPIDDFRHEKIYPRQKSRSMGRVATLLVYNSEKALEEAGLRDDPVLQSGRTGVAVGSSFGSTEPIKSFVSFMETGKSSGLNATSYIRMMSHTAPANIAVFFGLQGRVITTSSACTSASQGIGYAFEAIRSGAQDVMLAGGSDEFCVTMTMVFDRLYATARRHDDPQHSVRPFDESRDGLVIGEASGIVVLEELEHALARGARPIAEVVGFATNCDGAHISQPNRATQEIVMRQALGQARMTRDDLSYVSGHGTGTVAGDIEESHASMAVYGDKLPFHTIKGNFGHSLGGCAVIEVALGIEMLKEGRISPIANLTNVDLKCAELDYVMGESREVSSNAFASSNFAFGGINTSLVISNYD